jgi:hypothetical protein
MSIRKKLEIDNTEVLVQSAKEDGSGNNIENTYAKQDGYYGSMGVGRATLSDNFDTKITLIDTIPYLSRTAGGSLEIGNTCKEEKFTGASVIWNQIINPSASDYDSGIIFSTNTNKSFRLRGTATAASIVTVQSNISIISGHKYLLTINHANMTGVTIGFESGMQGASYRNFSGDIFTATSTTTTRIRISVTNGTAVGDFNFYVLCFDLTRMFGAGNEPTTIAQFKLLFPKDYYVTVTNPYWINVKTSGKKVVGFNAYDNSTGEAQIIGNNKYQVSGTYTALSFTDIYNNTSTPTLDSDDCFTPAANGILTVTDGDATTTCVSLYWDGERSGEWEAYNSITYPLDSSLELRGSISGFDTDGNAIYDGDTYTSDGTVTRKYAFDTVSNIPQFNQLWATSWFTTATNNGVTLTNNGNGSYTLSGTAGTGGSTFTYTSTGLTLDAGSKYIAFNIPGSISFGDANNNSYYPVSSAFTLQPQITIEEGADFTTNVTFYPLFVDMTALSGAGNELTSANFTSLFPGDSNHYYAYKAATANTDGATDYVYRTLDNVNYLYKLSTPITETAAVYTEIQQVDNWGIEEFLTDSSNDVAMSVGHYTEYLPDLKAKLEAAPESPEEDGYYLMQRDEGLNSYASFNTALTNNTVTINGQSVAGTGDIEVVSFGIIRLTE